jgi:cellulose biosynthesis protein BcsQ
MQQADAVLLPIKPSSLDIKAGYDALKLARQARTMRKGKLGIGLVPNRMVRTRLGADLLSALVNMGEKVLPPIGNRSVVAESATNGLTVRKSEPKSVSAKEFAAQAIGVEGLLPA